MRVTHRLVWSLAIALPVRNLSFAQDFCSDLLKYAARNRVESRIHIKNLCVIALLLLLLLPAWAPPAIAAAPPRTSAPSRDKPPGLRVGKGFSIPWFVITSVPGPRCDALPNGGKKCTVPTLVLNGPDWTTVVGVNSNTNHFITFSQATSNSVVIELNYDYSSMVKAAYDPDVKFFYRLMNSNGAVLATIEHDWWRKCHTWNVHESFSRSTPNIDVVRDIDHVDMYIEYRSDVSWAC